MSDVMKSPYLSAIPKVWYNDAARRKVGVSGAELNRGYYACEWESLGEKIVECGG